MKRQKRSVENIQRALQAMYRSGPEKPCLLPGTDWERSAMQRIRALGPLPETPCFPAVFSTAAWRLAPVAAALILALGTWMLQLDFTAEIERAALMDPIGFDVVTKLGIM